MKNLLSILVFAFWGLLFFCPVSSAFGQSLVDHPKEIDIQELKTTVVDSVHLMGNSASFYGLPHLLPLSDPAGGLHGIPAGQPTHGNWEVFFIAMGLLMIAMARYLFPKRGYNYLKAVFATHYLNQIEREGNIFEEILFYLLMVNFFLVISLLLTRTLLYFDLAGKPEWTDAGGLFFLVMAGVLLFLLLKSMAVSFLAWVFNTWQATRPYMKNWFLFNLITGIVLLPLAAYLTYNPSIHGFTVAWAIWLVANIIKLARGTIIGLQSSDFPAYYFILYLCSVEIIPLLLVIKLGIAWM